MLHVVIEIVHLTLDGIRV